MLTEGKLPSPASIFVMTVSLVEGEIAGLGERSVNTWVEVGQTAVRKGGTPSDILGMGVRYYNRDWRGHHSVPEEASTFLGVTHQWIWEDVTLLCYRPGYYLVVTVEILALK